MDSRKGVWMPQVIVIVLLLWALKPDNPYGYYILLRWICFGIFGYLTLLAYLEEKQNLAWVLGIIAVIYNPFFRVHLNRELWSVINVITIGIAAVTISRMKKKEGEKAVEKDSGGMDY